MSSNQENQAARVPPENIAAGVGLIIIGCFTLLIEYGVFEKPGFGWGLVAAICGLAALGAYFSTRPETNMAETGCALLFFGVFSMLESNTGLFDYCIGYCWQGLLIAMGLAGLCAIWITGGKSKGLFTALALISVGITFLPFERHYQYVPLHQRWIIAGTVVLILYGLSLIARAFIRGKKRDE